MPRPERTFRTPAIILKRRDFGEADRLVTLLTPEHGKIEAVAKGARKATGTKTGHVELFTRAEMLISRGRDLAIIAQAEMIEPYLPLREDLQRGAYATYCAELVDKFTGVGDEELGRVFTLLDAALRCLCIEEDLRLTTRYYELHFLDAVGFRPELHQCVFTRETIQAEDQFFSYAEGGIVSPAAAQHEGNLTPVTMTVLKILRHMQRSPFDRVRTLQLSPKLHADLERIMMGYITFILERRLQSVDFIYQLRRM